MTLRKALVTFSLVLGLVAACAAPAGKAAVEAPATPAMPDHWKVVTDLSFAPADIAPVAKNLGAEVVALRNTTFDVGGKQVKLNTIVAATPADAGQIVAALGKLKSPEAFHRRGLIVFEFVGANDVLPEIHAGMALLVAAD